MSDPTWEDILAQFPEGSVLSKIDKVILPPVPKYEVKLPTTYDRDQISTLLANADAKKRVMIFLGLKLGLRDQELQHAEFGDVHWMDRTFRVQGKPKWGFRPKTWEQREIPIPDDLLIELKIWKNDRSSGERGGEHNRHRSRRTGKTNESDCSRPMAQCLQGGYRRPRPEHDR